MQYWGQVLSLINFEGPITITSNTFINNTIRYQGGCEQSWNIYECLYGSYEASTPYYTYGPIASETSSQMRNMISIQGTPY